MSLTNSETRYGAVAKTFHWSIALGILAMIPLGIVANDLPYDTAEQLARKAMLFSIHKTVGVILFALALLRILWALSQPKPAPLHPDRKLETLAAEVAHWLLYGSLVLVPLSGWVHHAATTGFAPIWGIGQDLPLVPKSEALAGATAALHHVATYVLMGALAAHVAGALKHHVIDRDATLRRMLPGRTQAGSPARHRGALAGLAGALVVWGGALGAGAALGVFAHDDRPAPAAALATVESDWQVQEGTLGLTVSQFGSAVTGSFADWTAQIAYQDSSGAGNKGSVTVTVSIPSLTLGSVTGQAMGPDFFAAEAHPTATFAADILADESGALRAEGTLTIKDQSMPVTLPFILEVQEDRATMTGSLALDRREFGIGGQMTDPAQLGFEVTVDVALTATRG
ncbi:cytochrome b/b6 domain-containing protein [Thetidibacter halocola]|uniref:Cytochrome b/b6 domain-containing protein n=1 Tax=Thetidibacter halocola TaxID=2827239 RepID=A0A8J7WF56_9RHOB|nr:cytochrome b/b6 domain-containing protein [Thetidibacter halocola]MBS0124208.1 cytochrome b/b6 domain-containing protein [Thetidibacter halocola]